MSFPAREPDYDPNDSSMRDRSPRHAADQRLRSAGFEIAARPNTGPTLWRRRNRRGDFTELTQHEALALLQTESAATTAKV